MRASRLSQVDAQTPQRDPTDEQLMHAVASDDEDALQALISRYQQPLIWYLSSQGRRPDEAEDITQEVFVRVWVHRQRWETRTTVRSYLYRIAHNLMVSAMRHQAVKRRAEPHLVRQSADVVTPIDAAAHREFKEAFERALADLPERRREAFTLVRNLGMSLEEAAEVLGVTRRTIANHLYLAVTDLRKRLEVFLT